MAYKAYVTELKNVRKHPNADKLQLGECFGNTVCVNLNYYEEQIGVYFPTDLQLSIEFCEQNNLIRKKDENGKNIGGYMDPDKRNVKAIRLRGEKSDGLFLSLSCLESFGDVSILSSGDIIDVFNGHEICTKYIPRTNKKNNFSNQTKKKKKENMAPLFMEHVDTEQLAYNLQEFKPGDEIEITLKMHGTSQRTGYLPVFKGFKNDFWGRIMNKTNPERKMGRLAYKLYNKAFNKATPIYDWGYVSGTRKTILTDYEGGFYGSDDFREKHSKIFEGKLWKGETVYYEVVGFITNGTPIMGSCKNKKLNDKDFIKKYGEITTFSYGCAPEGYKFATLHDKDIFEEVPVPQSDIYVYRMTMTNEDGDVVEYTPNFMRYRCEQMGVKTVPVFEKFYIPNENELNAMGVSAGEYVKDLAEKFYDGPDPIGKTHIKEGVVIRVLNKSKFTAYKHKNFEFKVISNIISENIVNEMSNDILAEM